MLSSIRDYAHDDHAKEFDVRTYVEKRSQLSPRPPPSFLKLPDFRCTKHVTLSQLKTQPQAIHTKEKFLAECKTVKEIYLKMEKKGEKNRKILQFPILHELN